MEYTIILLLVTLIVIIYFKKPNKMQNAMIDAVVKNIRENESKIIEGSYSKLPYKVREDLNFEILKSVVSTVVDLACDVLEQLKR